MHHPTDRVAHTTAFVTPVVENWLEREIGIRETYLRVHIHSGFRTRPLAGTASGMASDSVRGRRI